MKKKLFNEKLVFAAAQARNLRIAPSKINKIIKQLRGKKYLDALFFLKKFPQKSGSAIWNLLHSAVANATNNMLMSKEKLIISEIYVNQASILKRMRPRARGKSYKIEKKLCHLSIFIKENF